MTIKELSRELQVSEQALRSWCKRNGVRKERKQSLLMFWDITQRIFLGKKVRIGKK